jgi:hypothetical protein
MCYIFTALLHYVALMFTLEDEKAFARDRVIGGSGPARFALFRGLYARVMRGNMYIFYSMISKWLALAMQMSL